MFLLETRKDEAVDGILLSHLRNLGTLWRNERPVRLPFGTRIDPLFDQCDLLLCERVPDRGHALRLLIGAYAKEERAMGGVTRSEHSKRTAILCVQTQVGHAALLIRAMATEAVVGEDRPDVAIEIDR
jgi:hypothetical protein